MLKDFKLRKSHWEFLAAIIVMTFGSALAIFSDVEVNSKVTFYVTSLIVIFLVLTALVNLRGENKRENAILVEEKVIEAIKERKEELGKLSSGEFRQFIIEGKASFCVDVTRSQDFLKSKTEEELLKAVLTEEDKKFDITVRLKFKKSVEKQLIEFDVGKAGKKDYALYKVERLFEEHNTACDNEETKAHKEIERLKN
jgi:hypothetical protein